MENKRKDEMLSHRKPGEHQSVHRKLLTETSAFRLDARAGCAISLPELPVYRNVINAQEPACQMNAAG